MLFRSVAETISIQVNEFNKPPVLTVPGTQVINEQTALNVSASATDPDIPVNPLTFSLLNPPSGMTINSSSGAISWTPTEAQGPGAYSISVVVTDLNTNAVNAQQLSVTNSFSVTVNEVNTAPTLPVISNKTINELTTLTVTNTASDSDIPANSLTYTLLVAPTNAAIDANGIITWTPNEGQGPGVFTFTTRVTDSNSSALVNQQLSATNTFTVTVNEVNTAPVLTVPGNQTLNEQTVLSVSASATDSDIPTNTLTFSLASPPTGMTINGASGAISWTPTEAQGSNVYTINVVVTDLNTNATVNQQISVTNSFTVTVNEVNTAPLLTVPANQTINEGTALNVSASATDSDLPSNALTFSLVSPPSGMTINSSSGAIAWTPTEAQGPNVYTITVVVTDSNPSAVNQTSFSVTNTFQVTVNEVNTAPVLSSIGNQTVNAGAVINFTATATDADSPPNTLTFSLPSAPSGATIGSGSGVFNWRPTIAQANTTNNITVRVTDNGSPALFDEKTFTVTVNPLSQVRLTLLSATNQTATMRITGDVGPDYMIQGSSSLTNWTTLLNTNPAATPFLFTDPNATTNKKFYRVLLGP